MGCFTAACSIFSIFFDASHHSQFISCSLSLRQHKYHVLLLERDISYVLEANLGAMNCMSRVLVFLRRSRLHSSLTRSHL